VEFRHVTKVFPRTLLLRGRSTGAAIEDVSMEALKGEVVALLGENGAGKTTLLKIAATLITPTSGNVYISGIDAVRNDRKARELVSFATNSDRSFYYRLDGWNNLRFFCGLYGMSLREIEENIEPYLDALSMRDAMNIAYMYMSTGMRRKLALLRTLALRKPVILLDEPTSNMDPRSAKQVASIVGEIKARGECTVLLSTNNLEDAELLADRAVILKKGKVVLSQKLPPRENRRGTVEIEVERAAYVDVNTILPGAVETVTERGKRFVKSSEDAVNELNRALDKLRAQGIKVLSADISGSTVQQMMESCVVESSN